MKKTEIRGFEWKRRRFVDFVQETTKRSTENRQSVTQEAVESFAQRTWQQLKSKIIESAKSGGRSYRFTLSEEDKYNYEADVVDKFLHRIVEMSKDDGLKDCYAYGEGGPERGIWIKW